MERLTKTPYPLASRLALWFIALVLLTLAAAWLPEIRLIQDRFQRETWGRLEQGRIGGRALYLAVQTEIANTAILAAQLPTLQEQVATQAVVDLQDYLQTLETNLNLDLVAVCDPQDQVLAIIGVEFRNGACGPESRAQYMIVDDDAGAEVWLIARQPIRREDGVLGMVVTGLHLDDEFAERMRDQTALEHTILVDGEPVATSLAAGVSYWNELSDRRPYDADRVEGEQQFQYELNGEPYYATRLDLAQAGLQDEVALTASGIARTQQMLARTQVISILVVTLLSSTLSVVLARRISRPLTDLADEAAAFSHGDLSSPIEVETRVQEISRVAQALEQTRVELRGTLETLEGEKAWIENLLQAIVEGIVTLDKQGRVTFYSRGAEQITSTRQADALGKHCNEVFQTAQDALPFSELVPKPGSQRRIPIVASDGRPLTISVTRAELAPPEAGAARVALVFRDVSEEEAYRRLINHFMANVTHEFRTPLTALGASVELLLDQTDTVSEEELRHMLGWLHLGIFNLQTLVDNLLESASLEAGRFQVAPAPADLGEIIAEAARSMQPLLEKYDQHLSVSLPSNIPVVQADARRVVQVLVNLLSNANKYGPEDSEITLEVTRANDHVWVHVSDEGPGIPDEFKDDLFHRFVHYGAQADKGKYGIGLGLWVVKAIVEAHGGAVGVEEREEGGARFWFTLPVAEES
ncbi:MAG: ATP-binding protein [Chloroflexota bacterium]